MKHIVTAIAALLALTLTACGNDAEKPAKSYSTSDAIIDDVRNSGFDCELDPYNGAIKPGMMSACVTEDGGAIVARTFDSSSDYDAYVASMTGPVIFGELWALECTELVYCEDAHNATGGELIN